jgi:hypothetical protein
MPCRFGNPIALCRHEADGCTLQFCSIGLTFLCQHGTPPWPIFSLFSKCPSLLNHNTVRQRLSKLKQDYINTYMALYTKARLGVNDDKRKAALLRDERVDHLQKLATIELMPASQLTDFRNRLAGLKSCFALTEPELQATPICPHCGFKPATEQDNAAAGAILTAMDDELDKLAANWTKTLLDNLADPTTQENLALLTAERRKQVEPFVTSRRLPDRLSQSFIQVLQEASSGLV